MCKIQRDDKIVGILQNPCIFTYKVSLSRQTYVATIGLAVTELQQDKFFMTAFRRHVLLLPLICNGTGRIPCLKDGATQQRRPLVDRTHG